MFIYFHVFIAKCCLEIGYEETLIVHIDTDLDLHSICHISRLYICKLHKDSPSEYACYLFFISLDPYNAI